MFNVDQIMISSCDEKTLPTPFSQKAAERAHLHIVGAACKVFVVVKMKIRMRTKMETWEDDNNDEITTNIKMIVITKELTLSERSSGFARRGTKSGREWPCLRELQVDQCAVWTSVMMVTVITGTSVVMITVITGTSLVMIMQRWTDQVTIVVRWSRCSWSCAGD